MIKSILSLVTLRHLHKELTTRYLILRLHETLQLTHLTLGSKYGTVARSRNTGHPGNRLLVEFFLALVYKESRQVLFLSLRFVRPFPVELS